MKLNLDKFNEIIMSAITDQPTEKKIEMLKMAIELAARYYLDKVHYLLDELDKSGYESELFAHIGNIMSNIEQLLKQVDELEAEAVKEKARDDERRGD